jgi:hypothetical protein
MPRRAFETNTIFIFIFAILSLSPAFADSASAFSMGSDSPQSCLSLEMQGYYGFSNHEDPSGRGFAPVEYGTLGGSNNTERDTGSAWGSAGVKAIIDYSVALPFLRLPGSLTSGNNLRFDLSGELSPVSLNANLEAGITPVAFMSLFAGAGLGTGWDIGFVGLGLNDSSGIQARDLDGFVYRVWVKSSFQFDLAALLPGEWRHIVILASPKLIYLAYSEADEDEAWIWEADDGMDFNGWKLKGSYFLGYQMPLKLSMAGILLETEGFFGSLRDRSPMTAGWGSDYTYYSLGFLANFRLNERSNLAILPQFKTGIRWSDETYRIKYFEYREYKGSYWYFNRIVFDYSLKL